MNEESGIIKLRIRFYHDINPLTLENLGRCCYNKTGLKIEEETDFSFLLNDAL